MYVYAIKAFWGPNQSSVIGWKHPDCIHRVYAIVKIKILNSNIALEVITLSSRPRRGDWEGDDRCIERKLRVVGFAFAFIRSLSFFSLSVSQSVVLQGREGPAQPNKCMEYSVYMTKHDRTTSSCGIKDFTLLQWRERDPSKIILMTVKKKGYKKRVMPSCFSP